MNVNHQNLLTLIIILQLTQMKQNFLRKKLIIIKKASSKKIPCFIKISTKYSLLMNTRDFKEKILRKKYFFEKEKKRSKRRR